MVALVITSLLMALLMGALHFVLQVREKLGTEIQVGDHDARLNLWVGRLVQGLVPVRSDSTDACVGSETEVSFLSTGALSVAADGAPQWVTLRFHKTHEGALELEYEEGATHQVLAHWDQGEGHFTYTDFAGKPFPVWKVLLHGAEVAPRTITLELNLPSGKEAIAAAVRSSNWLDLPPENLFDTKSSGG